MHRRWRTAGVVLAAASSCFGQSSERQKLIQQVEAADALAQMVEREAQTAPTGSRVAQPGDRLAWDQVLKAAMAGIRQSAAGGDAADIAELNDYQLRQAAAHLQIHNLALYMQLSARPVQADAPNVFQSTGSVQGELTRARAHATTQPTRSAILMMYLTPPKTVQRSTMDSLVAAAQRQDAMEARRSSTMTPDQLTAVLSGQQINRAFGVASTIAPTDARMPGSKQLNEVSPQTLPMANDVAGTVALRADPPGNPPEVVPKPEEVARLVNALGVTPDVAEQLATGRVTLSEAMAGKRGSNQKGSADALVANDPRWQRFYSGSMQGVRDWLAAEDSFESFVFQPGGGRYERSDQRVNNNSDMRTNSEPDRRVNINADRRTTIQLDPRATNQP